MFTIQIIKKSRKARKLSWMGAVALIALAAGSADAQTTTRYLTVKKHEYMTVPGWAENAHVDAMFADASAILTNVDWADISCPQRFYRSGNIGTFGAACGRPAGDYLTIDTEDETNAILNCIPGYVKIVYTIDYCGKAYDSLIAGCANKNSMVLEDRLVQDATNVYGTPGATKRGIAMAHEFGHTVGLGHASSKDRVMYEQIEGQQVRVLDWECSKFQMSDLASNGGPAALIVQPDESPSEFLSIEEVATNGFLDSVPADLNEHYGERDVETLRKMLKDEKFASSWANAANLIGRLSDGSDEDVQALIAFASAPGRDPRDVTGAGFGLGYLANRIKSPAALEYLVQMSNSNDAHRLKAALYGLAMSGKPKALAHLKRMKTLLDGHSTLDRTVLSPNMLGDLMEHASFIAEHGLRRYYTRSKRH